MHRVFDFHGETPLLEVAWHLLKRIALSLGPQFLHPPRIGEQMRSGGVIVKLCKALLEWLSGCKRHLLEEFRELLCLLAHPLDLMASMIG
jgi:hypothetical protein